MNTIIQAAFSRTGAVLMALAVLSFVGVGAYFEIPKEAKPDVDIPVTYVSVKYEGISPEDSERLLVKPLEKHLRTVEGLDKMTSVGAEGYGAVTLEFAAGEDIDQALVDVRQAVEDAKPDLPAEADEPKVTEVSLSLFPILTAALYGPVPEREMVLAAREIKDKLESLPGILEVEIGGDREEVLEILVDASAMESYGLNPAAVINLVQSNNQLVTAGAIDDGGGRLLVKVPGVIEDIDDLINMPIKANDGTSIKFGDVAVVRRAFRQAEGWSRVNGEPAIVLDVRKRVGSNIIDVVELARAVIDAAAPMIDEEVKVSYLFDDSKDVRNLLSDLGNNVGAAVIIVMVVVLAVLGIRNATLVGLAIPGSFFIGITLLNFMGVTMNIIVLFSLILVAGMLVDGVIVTTEFADRKIAAGMSRKEAYKAGAQRMAWPIISSTVTTLMVFTPLLFWPGIVGQFMKYLPITVICVLLASLFMALIFIPVLGGMIGKKTVEKGSISSTAPHLYRRILKFSIRRPGIIMAGVISIMIFAFMGYGRAGLGVAFFPSIEPDQAQVQVLARGDLSAKERDGLVREAEESISSVGGVEDFYARSFRAGDAGNQAPRDSVGTIRTVFTNWDKREKAVSLMDQMRALVSTLAGAEVTITQQQEGPGGALPIRVEILGDDLDELAAATNDVVARMNELGGFVDIVDSRPLPGLEWTLVTDRDAASRHGVSISGLGTMIKMLTRGVRISDFRPDDTEDELDVVMRFMGDQRNLDRLKELRIPAADGSYIPLSVFADLQPRQKGGNIERLDGKRYMYINSDVESGVLAAERFAALRQALADAPLAQDVEIKFGGENEDIAETQSFLATSFMLSLVLMVIILMVQFNSGWQAFVTMSAIVLSTGGVVLGLWVTNQPFGVVMCGLGVISLAGIVVNNNIVLIDTFNEYRKRGYSASHSAFRAGLVRFRPVVLTAVTTILGLMPMVYQLTIKLLDREILVGAPSSQWWTQLSSTIAGGLTFATILTLVATPAMLVIGNYLGRFASKAIGERFRQFRKPALDAAE
ncbi:efflux RND transporter permease subunit [Alphaproteobacteria bacterium]|nr:efflux RND transporter permease subunit [Alphaproteobacteria bacterium]